jgi:integrase
VGVFKNLDPYSIMDAKAALAKRQVQRRERRLFDMLPESEMTFDELAKWFLNLKSVRKLAAFERYEQALNNFTRVFGKIYLTDIRQTHLEEYQIERREQGAADATDDYEIKVAQAAVNKAFDNDKVNGACLKPFRRTKRLLKFGANARDVKVTVAQYLKLLEFAPSYYRSVLIVAYNTGMRKGEIKQLKWSYIDWANMMIRLPKEVTKENKPKAGAFGFSMSEGKSKKSITIHGWPRAMPVELAARYIGLAPKTLRNRLCRRAVNPFPVKRRRQGGKVIFFKEDLDQYLDGLPVEEPEP